MMDGKLYVSNLNPKRRLDMKWMLIFLCNFIPLTLMAAPPKLSIIHFDVNVGDATLIITPDGRGVLIDAGKRGRGKNPIVDYLIRAKNDKRLTSLDYTIVSHYDADHLGGMDEVYNAGWYPEVAAYDRGNSNLRPFLRKKLINCKAVDIDIVENLAPWGGAPNKYCPKSSKGVTCQIAEYFSSVEAGGKRKEMKAGDVIELDHEIKITALIANAKDIDGNTENVYFSGRRKDCAENDLSIGVLLEYGDFKYLLGGDLTGDPNEKVADVEELIKDNVSNVDVYHVNHHGALTSSSIDFMEVINPTVAIVSNGEDYGHPRKEVINNRILSLDSKPAVYLTNLNDDEKELAWNDDLSKIADHDYSGYDGTIEISVWKRSYRIWLWRNGKRISKKGKKYLIKK